MPLTLDQDSLQKSKNNFERAKRCIPGGVNSPVRAYTAVEGNPIFIERASGAEIIDIDGNAYIDYVNSWGPLLLGHASQEVLEAVFAAAHCGFSFGAPCRQEILLAEEICRRVPSLEKVRMVNSGTEATMTAIRLARGVTRRNKIIKFSGCYHGHVDALLVEAGSGALTLGQPSSLGVPQGVVADTLIGQYNVLNSVEALFSAYPDEIAAVILEPLCGNMGVVLPRAGFIEGLRTLCDHYNSLLIFDEVMTGFRVSPAGFQGISTVQPDLTTLGKIIGGGFPVGAVGGAGKYMDELAPEGRVYQAGTLSGNPVAMAAGLATLQATSLSQYRQLAAATEQLAAGCLESAKRHGIAVVVNAACGMLTLFFTELPSVDTYADTCSISREHFKKFFRGLLARGIYWPPSPFEAAFLSMAQSPLHITKTLEAIDNVFANW